MSACPLAFEALVDYWLGEGAAAEAEAIEEHVLGCARCAVALERVAALGAGVREAARRGNVRAVVDGRYLEEAARRGLRVREYRLAPGGTIHCTVAPDDDLLVARLAADLSGVAGRVDLVWSGEGGEERLSDLPVSRATGEVVWLERIDEIRKLPATVQHARLVAVDESGERPIAEYVFDHSPWR